MKRSWNIWTRLGLAMLALWVGVAAGAEYPERPVTIVVPYAAGGATDSGARLVAQALQQRTGVAFVVENVPGAGTTIGSARVARAAPDGYTLLWGGLSSNVLAPQIYPKLSFDAARAFAPVSMVASQPFVLFVSSNSPWHTLGDLLAFAKAKPGQLNFGSPGQGSAPHVTSQMFLDLAHIQAQHVPYRGAAPAIAALLGGEIQMLFDTPTAGLQMVKTGRLRALAVSSQRRLPELPEVPTMREAGLPEFQASTWFALFAPSGTPAATIDKMNALVRDVLKERDVLERFQKAQFLPMPSTPKALSERVTSETELWGKIIKQHAITTE